ncbi:hypothetical protein SNEBB_010113 [Seison nebaliae]|nr:hypothetical protein SNEBB_010113 [Seison nebaliae]
MSRYGALVVGPAGAGKSTLCTILSSHFSTIRRRHSCINLDPAAEHFDYNVDGDVRNLISVDDIAEDEELRLGPNGALIFAIKYLSENVDFLESFINMESIDDDTFYLFDCPGQLELYTDCPEMINIISHLTRQLHFNLVVLYVIDAHFLVERSKYIAASLAGLSTMMHLEMPQLNVVSKMDLLSSKHRNQIEDMLDENTTEMLDYGYSVASDGIHDDNFDMNFKNNDDDETSSSTSPLTFTNKFGKLTKILERTLYDYSLVKFSSIHMNDEESIEQLTLLLDNCIQYGENFDVREDSDMLPKEDD